MMKGVLLISFVTLTTNLFSQVSMFDHEVTCNYDYDARDNAIHRYIVDTSFIADTFKITISNVQNCGYEKALHQGELIDNRLVISNTLEKEIVDSLGNVTLFLVGEEECECLFKFTYRFLGLSRGQSYEIIYNNDPIYYLDCYKK